jgi:type I restriction-modification system DNA methylase subunit
MFVQSARFVEKLHENPNDKLSFYGLEKNATTINLAKMNLAVHGLVGDIKKAITYYEDPHNLLGKADFVMANPPFNVDEIDADKIKNDPRLPFGLPGVNKKGKVSNGNYVWISYFYSYLTKQGRAGFVMSSQASSAGKGESKVREKLIETGHVDIMIAIRSNFFYTRTVPCELWFIDRAKPDQPSTPSLLPEGEGLILNKIDHYRGGYNFSGLVKRARELRNKKTPAEGLFWDIVRDRQFLDLKFRRQHQVGSYVLDFYCHEMQIAIEFDGAVHENRQKKDGKRDAYLTSLGIKVIRIPNEKLLNDPESVLNEVFKILPSPSGRGTKGEGERMPIGEGERMPLNHKGHVLMIDARNIFRKVTRKIYDFSPEQLQNILSIIWLYRGENKRFHDLVGNYISTTLNEAVQSIAPAQDYETVFAKLNKELQPFLATLPKDGKQVETVNPVRELRPKSLPPASSMAFSNGVKELADCLKAYTSGSQVFAKLAQEKSAWWKKQNKDTIKLTEALKEITPLAEENNKLIKEAELMYRLANRLIDVCLNTCNAKESDKWNAREIANLKKQTEEVRDTAINQLKLARYFHHQAQWLIERFPEGKLLDVEGLVKLVDKAELKENDWSLTPGRYVGVAPEEEDPDFDFGETIRTIHTELVNLNTQAAEMAKKISQNFKNLGI